MELADLQKILSHELSSKEPGLIAVMGQKSPSFMKDIPAVMDEFTILDMLANDSNTALLDHLDLGEQDRNWLVLPKIQDTSQKIVCCLQVPANELNIHSFWLTDRVPKAIQGKPTKLVLMYEYKDQVLFPEWFVLLFWGELDDFCLPVLTHYSMLEQDIGDWNETALYRSEAYGINLNELLARFKSVDAELKQTV